MRKRGYEFYLKRCLLPVAPARLQIKINNTNKALTLINDGQINILKQPGLTEIEFECEIPQVKQTYAIYKSGFRGAAYFLDYFEGLKNNHKPFQFIVTRILPNGKSLFSTNIKVSMEDYTITEDAKNGFSLQVKIKLKQYREYGSKTVSIKTESNTATVEKERPGVPPEKKGYAVGDIVNFHGGTHYYSSYPGAKGYFARAGKAKITIANGSGKAHPWHLIHVDSGSNVYGWVDEGTFD